MSKQWINVDELLKELQDVSKYVFIDLEFQNVDPSKIVSLSRELDPDKLQHLRNRVTKNGWLDISPIDLELILLPDGQYAVAGGGNHRAYLSNELGLSSIVATVFTYMEISYLTPEEIQKLKDNELKKDEYFRILREEKRNKKLRENAVYGLNDLEVEEKAWLRTLYAKYKSP